jgi:hypothetical protein
MSCGSLYVLLPIFADRTLGGDSRLFGALLGALAAGEVVSAVVAGGRRNRRSLGLLICLCQMPAGAALGLLLFENTVLAFAGLVLFGAFSAPLTIWAQTLRMVIIPERLRGRAFALLRMLMMAGDPLGGAMAGPLLPLLGVPVMVLLAVLLVGFPGALGARVRALREAGQPVPASWPHHRPKPRLPPRSFRWRNSQEPLYSRASSRCLRRRDRAGWMKRWVAGGAQAGSDAAGPRALDSGRGRGGSPHHRSAPAAIRHEGFLPPALVGDGPGPCLAQRVAAQPHRDRPDCAGDQRHPPA